jgi:plasmid stabilization system protein ParE
MKIFLQQSADDDVRWFMRYYRKRFPEGRRNARLQMARAFENLAENPQMGHPIEGTTQREFSVPRTPFRLIYQIENNRIEILRVWDGRANPARLTDEGLDPS